MARGIVDYKGVLNKCSKCGNEPNIIWHYMKGTANRKHYFVRCNNCLNRTMDRKNIEGAVEEWNNKVTNPTRSENMEDIRKTIMSKHEDLKQLEEYEQFLKYIYDEGKSHWWQIKTPREEFDMFTGETRRNFKEFIISEISRIKIELGIED